MWFIDTLWGCRIYRWPLWSLSVSLSLSHSYSHSRIQYIYLSTTANTCHMVAQCACDQHPYKLRQVKSSMQYVVWHITKNRDHCRSNEPTNEYTNKTMNKFQIRHENPNVLANSTFSFRNERKGIRWFVSAHIQKSLFRFIYEKIETVLQSTNTLYCSDVEMFGKIKQAFHYNMYRRSHRYSVWMKKKRKKTLTIWYVFSLQIYGSVAIRSRANATLLSDMQ